ncbi:MAG: hypothetical protein P8163_16310 [Candidatus Thiodiazotropha sp.]
MGWSLTRNKIPANAGKHKLVWHVDRYSEITGLAMENFDKYSIPFSLAINSPPWTIIGPNGKKYSRIAKPPETAVDKGTGDIEELEKILPEDVVIQLAQKEIMNYGYGKNIKLNDFLLVSAFLENKITDFGQKTLKTGQYSFDDFILKKLMINKRKITKKDRFLYGSVYPGSKIKLYSNDRIEDSYVHGTVGFALMKSTKFVVSNSYKAVFAEVGALDDNWDYSSSSGFAKLINNILYSSGFGVYNKIKIAMEYYGPGKKMSIKKLNK